VTSTYRFTSDSAIPSATPPASVSGNDVKPPISAAASAGITSSVSVVTCSCVIGAMSRPASPARAAPRNHVSEEIRSGDHPSAAAALVFSDTADIAQPIRE
jgi:hypothetical protein